MAKTSRSQKSSKLVQGKQGASLMDKIEKTYGKDFGVNTDMKLETFLKKAGYPSLGKMLK